MLARFPGRGGLSDIQRAEIHCDEANVASAAVPRRLGYHLDRIVPDEVEAPGEVGRSMIWVMDAQSWKAVSKMIAEATPN